MLIFLLICCSSNDRITRSYIAMRCLKCHCEDTKVIDSRPGKDNTSIRRRRTCANCGHRFSTVEEIIREDLIVIKRDGRREDFDISKLIKGVQKATEKRPVSEESIELLVQQVVAQLQRDCDSEVSSAAIGEAIIEHLKQLDKIAYVRFASVYKDFRDIDEFAQAIKSLK